MGFTFSIGLNLIGCKGKSDKGKSDNQAAKERQIQGSVSTTDLAGTIRRSRELFKEIEDELERVRKQNQGNDIMLRAALEKVTAESINKREQEFAKLQGQTVQWRFTVREVKLFFGKAEVFLEEPQGDGGGNETGLFIMFGIRGGWNYLQAGKDIPSALAEKLRPGDLLLVRGKASVRVGAGDIGPYNILNRTVNVEVKLADITTEQVN